MVPNILLLIIAFVTGPDTSSIGMQIGNGGKFQLQPLLAPCQVGQNCSNSIVTRTLSKKLNFLSVSVFGCLISIQVLAVSAEGVWNI